jgi:hypothetical protein
MTQATEMLDTYPADLGGIDKQALARCIEACIQCAQVCTECADACLSEPRSDELLSCVRTNLNCADICTATARVLSRHLGDNVEVGRTMLQACLSACRACGAGCGGQASEHAHCRICADACGRCEQACGELLAALK